MSKAQPATTPAIKRPAKQMYRGVITAQAVMDVFVRTTSDVAANAAIKRGKGQKMKLRFGEWQLLQEAIAVDTYAASTIPVPRNGGLTAEELGKVYVQVLHKISVSHSTGVYADSERQAMADAVREFYDQATEVIRAKAAR